MNIAGEQRKLVKGYEKSLVKFSADDEPLCDWRRIVKVEELEGAVCSHGDMSDRFRLSMLW